MQLFSLPAIFIALTVFGKFLNPFHLGLAFWLPTMVIWFGFYPLNTYLYTNAIRHGELSKVLPLQSLGPIFALLLGWLLLHQKPSLLAVGGIVTVVTGVYTLNITGKRLHNPVKMFTANRPNLLYTCSMLTTCLAAVLDKIAMQASDPMYYTFVTTLGAVPVLFAVSKLFGVKEFALFKRHIRPLFVTGCMSSVTFATYSFAISIGPVAYVTAVRSSSLLMGAVIGIVYFKELFTRLKAYTLVLIAIGVVILALQN